MAALSCFVNLSFSSSLVGFGFFCGYLALRFCLFLLGSTLTTQLVFTGHCAHGLFDLAFYALDYPFRASFGARVLGIIIGHYVKYLSLIVACDLYPITLGRNFKRMVATSPRELRIIDRGFHLPAQHRISNQYSYTLRELKTS